MSDAIITLKLEQLFKTWLSGLTWANSVNFYTGTGKGDESNDPMVKLPRCVVACEGATERIKDTCIYDTQLVLTVTHSADDTDRAVHAETSAEILNTVTASANVTLFNQTVDAHIYDIFPHSITPDQDERNWQTIIEIPMTASLGNMGA